MDALRFLLLPFGNGPVYGFFYAFSPANSGVDK